MEPLLNNGICRCCASEGTFKDFLTSYHWMGEEEIYADMLKDCFSITLTTSDEVSNGGICEVCITQLRNACNFKRQVQHTEEQFKRRLQDILLKSNPIKIEPARDDGDMSDNNLSEDFSANDYEVPIKVEKLDDKPKKRQAKASTSRAKKAKTTDGEPSAKRVRPESKANVTGVVLKLVRKVTPKTNIDDIPKSRQGSYELSKHWINAKEIFTWSNATPIRKQTDVGYVCCFCDAVYPEPAHLKQHTMESHDGINNSSFTKRRDLNAFHVKVDITGLNCKICKQDLDDLDKLIIHLKEDHQKTLFSDIKNHMIPFKFETSSLRCFICSSEFNKFKGLLEHMNTHCRNYICTVCEAGFINRRRLIVHSERHETGVFQCGICPEEFTTLAKRKLHVVSYHKPIKNRNRCGHCNETFKDYSQKQRHLITIHNIGNQYNCKACERTFPTRRAYRVHMRRDHLMERSFKCTECEKTFYCGSTLKCHLLKHSGLREFQCDICLKTYGRKSTLRDHLRIHADDRRFKCDHCGQAFVQKCSWRGHIRAKHGIEV